MKCSLHATIRLGQRGINHEFLELVLRFGASRYARDGVRKYMLDKKGRSQAIAHLRNIGRVQAIDKLKGVVVIADGSCVITAYHGGSKRYYGRF